MRRDRVLLFSTAQTLGGGEVYVERLANGLHNHFRVSVLANQRLLSRIAEPVSKFPLSRFPRAVERNIRGGYRLKEIYHYLRHGTGCLFKPDHTDLVHFQIYDARLLSLLAPGLRRDGIRQVITIHTEFKPERVAGKRPQPSEVLSEFSAIICVCNATKDNLISLGVPAEKCHVIHTGAQLQPPRPSMDCGAFVTWVGRIDERDKNPMLFVQIAEAAQRRNLGLEFRMVGEGPLLGYIREYTRTKNIRNLQLSGWSEDMQRVYNEAIVLCLTSTSEALPLVVLEAMASGVPVVASNVGGVPEILQGSRAGTIVANPTPECFLEAISLLCDSEHYQSASRNARFRIEESFTLNQTLERTARLYNELLLNA